MTAPHPPTTEGRPTLDFLRRAFAADGYICGDDVLVPVYLSLQLGRPLLVEGEPGVGKTEIGKVLSRILDTDLIRLQCYEGLDEAKALYEWNYQRQLLAIEAGRGAANGPPKVSDLFSEPFLLERPLLRALCAQDRAVLLIDEVDKCDEEFEAFLFEILSDFQVSIPELGTVTARSVPVVVLTSNRARELSDGLKRRCLYLYLHFPDVDTEVRIIHSRVPDAPEALSLQVARALRRLRQGLDLRKNPSIAEGLDWVRALVGLDADRLNPRLVASTLGLVLKNADDLRLFHERLGPEDLVREACRADDR